jgi:hypothetical protein
MTAAGGCLLSWPQRIMFVALIPILIPVALGASLWHWIKGGAETSPEELATMLRGVAEEGDFSGYWDELESVNLRDAQLESIRKEALKVSLPPTPEGRAKLIELAERAEALRPQP